MKLSMKWLSDFVSIDVRVGQFCEDMTMTGSKAEGFQQEGARIKNVVAGRVLSVEKHPNADSLYLCKVDVGKDETLQIVTGADNVVPGCTVPVALDNSVLADGKQIKKGKLRGELSQGMLCSLEELGLTAHDFPYAVEDGIFLLEEKCEIGQDICSAIGLDDTVAEFEITSNRPDCLSVIGLAREAGATYCKPLNLSKPQVKGSGGDVAEHLQVTVENPRLCLRYAAAAVRNVNIGPSPRWMRERLRASGVRPINNIVDITNYVMLEYGQPMHAFDQRTVNGQHLVIRNAREGESITTLDGVERALSTDMLVIADSKAPSAVAGVMGGENSGVYDDTSTVIFESACFYGPSVRMTSKKLGLRTESSSRFEKQLDPENCVPALRRACELVELLGAGEVADGMIDIAGDRREPVRIPLDPQWINRFLGIDIPGSRMEEILRTLEFQVEDNVVTPPSFRADVESAVDVAEEIARIYGYGNIPTTEIRGSAQGKVSPEQKMERDIRQILMAQGYSEIITYSFFSPKSYDRIGLPPDSVMRRSVVIQNPLGEDTSVMRTTAVPSMLDVLSRNYKGRNPSAALFEIATIYLPVPGEELPQERGHVVLGAYGAGAGFFTLKGALETLLERVGIREWDCMASDANPTFHPGRYAVLFASTTREDGTAKDSMLGYLGEVHPEVCGTYGLDEGACVACLDMESILRFASGKKQYAPLPRFPASTRDLALVCSEALPVGTIQKVISASAGQVLESIQLFDVYRGKQVGEGKKSVAYSLTLRASDRTLTDQECDQVVKRTLKALTEELGVELRG